MKPKFSKPAYRQTPRSARAPGPVPQFERMQASALYCSACREATPAREVLLLVLPDGNLYDYRCARCGTPTGSRTEKQAPAIQSGSR